VEEVGLEEKEGGAWHFTRMSRPDTIIAEGWADTREHWRDTEAREGGVSALLA
jgi:hypothetical protein